MESPIPLLAKLVRILPTKSNSALKYLALVMKTLSDRVFWRGGKENKMSIAVN